MVGFHRAHTQNLGRADVRTPMYAVGGNGHFCPADPMRRAPKEFLTLLHNSCDPNRGRTTSTIGCGPLMLGTLAQDLKSPVQPPSLVQVLKQFSRYDTGFHLIRYAYAERCRSLSAGAKIEFIRYDYKTSYRLGKLFEIISKFSVFPI